MELLNNKEHLAGRYCHLHKLIYSLKQVLVDVAFYNSTKHLKELAWDSPKLDSYISHKNEKNITDVYVEPG